MMILHGVDIYLYVREPQIPDVPRQSGPFTLIQIADRGTRVWPPPAPEMELLDWPRCRYFSETEVTDAQVDELVAEITKLGWQWTKTQKLFRVDGADAFSQAY